MVSAVYPTNVIFASKTMVEQFKEKLSSSNITAACAVITLILLLGGGIAAFKGAFVTQDSAAYQRLADQVQNLADQTRDQKDEFTKLRGDMARLPRADQMNDLITRLTAEDVRIDALNSRIEALENRATALEVQLNGINAASRAGIGHPPPR